MRMRNLLVALVLGAASLQASAQADSVSFLSASHCMMRPTAAGRYLMLPVQDRAELSTVRVIVGGRVEASFEVRLAVDNVDYYVPVDMAPYSGRSPLLDFHVEGSSRLEGGIKDHVCWSRMKYAATPEVQADEKFRPAYHHAPAWGWMNDPNGMFYKDGVWHLYYQWNPYGSLWGNMTWGHSTSTDLVNWKHEPAAVTPDGLGAIFSGSCVVDEDNTAGFGKGAIVAIYTSAGESQTQSVAYSTDGGMTFSKYEGNPVIVSDVPDFRDPHVFRHGPTGRWIMVLAAGQEIRIYSSADLKHWAYESSFGQGYGAHGGVWECPDLFELPVEGTGERKWVLICNINPGGPSGGSATQYFTGSFDGHRFTCDTDPAVTKWMDYGKDHYATVSFDNAPGSRRVVMGWMSNWQYANQVPTVQFRSANTIAREAFLYRSGGVDYLGSRPVAEMDAARGQAAVSASATLGRRQLVRRLPAGCAQACEIDMALQPADGATVELSLANAGGERLTVTYDGEAGTLSVDRRGAGGKAFSELFPAVTTAPLRDRLTSLRIYLDKSSVEVFANGGRTVLTNLVFPESPYDALTLKSDRKTRVSGLKVYPLR